MEWLKILAMEKVKLPEFLLESGVCVSGFPRKNFKRLEHAPLPVDFL